jgi:cytoskeletal protein CcmA (bactofilin family)
MIRPPLRQGRDEHNVFKRRSNRPEDESQEGASAQPIPGFPQQTPAGSFVPAQPADRGLGVPPFRPAPTMDKDPIAMARPPFAPNPTTVPNMPSPPPRPGVGPISGLQAPPRPINPADIGERRTLVVGRGISLHGTINDAERLVVEGTVEATMIRAAELSVIYGGVFKGEIEVEEAEIAGTIDGVITARTSLIVRASGSVLGRARCRRLQVEDGGQLTGQIEMLTDTSAPSATATPAVSAPMSPSSASDLSQPEVPFGATFKP